MGYTGNKINNANLDSAQYLKDIKICTDFYVDDTQSFWNDENREKSCEFWIDNDNGKKFFELIEKEHFLLQYKIIINKFVSTFKPQNNMLNIADIACGVGWTSALLSREPFAKKIHSVDFSMHRLGMFDKFFSILKGDLSKCTRYFASFYHLPFDDNSIDIVFISQGLHHADDISRLLRECYRVLSKNGKLLFIGEPFIPFRKWCWVFVKNIIKHIIRYRTRKPIGLAASNLFLYDQKLGDHYYTSFDYRVILHNNKFNRKYLLATDNILSGIYEKI